MDKVKSSFYLDKQTDREMRIKAAEVGLSYPSEFIVMLWDNYKAGRGRCGQESR